MNSKSEISVIKAIFLTAIAVISVVLPYSILVKEPIIGKAEAWSSNWSGWNCYRVLNINASNYTGYYQMRIKVLYNGNDDVANSTISCNGHCNANFSDIRFVDIDNTTTLPYWIENKSDGNYTIVWVNVFSNAMTDGKILMYYGNPSATDASDGDATFDFFDDFDNATLDTSKWEFINTNEGQYSIANSVITVTSKTAETGVDTGLKSLQTFNINDYVVEMLINRHGDSSQDGDIMGGFISSSTDFSASNWRSSTDPNIWSWLGDIGGGQTAKIRYYTGGSYSTITSEISPITTTPTRVTSQEVSGDMLLRIGDETATGTHTHPITDAYLTVFINAYSGYGFDLDWIAVRKYASPEPTWSSFGTEQTQSGWINTPPSFSNEQPANGSTGVQLQPTLSVNVTDADGNATQWWLWTSEDNITWTLQNNGTFNDGNGTITYNYIDADQYDTTYYWKVSANDGHDNVTAIYHFTTKTGTGWWNTDWQYYKVLYINSSGYSDYYQMKINVSYSTGGDVNCSSHCNADFSDIRFVDIDNTTVLPYWIEKKVNASYAIIWVNVFSNAMTDGKILMYYGNPSVSSESNANNTFIRVIDGVVGSWNFDEGSGTTAHDVSGNSNDGTIYGATWVDGKYNKALNFDGVNDYVSCVPKSFNITNEFSASEVGTSQQGVTTDGTYIYVTGNTNIFKYDMNGNYQGESAAISWHFGDLVYHDGYLYAAVSECPSSGTSTNHWIYKYDTNLNKVAEYDISSEFDVCPGAITYYNNHFYVAASYWDSDHYDKIVKYDTSFNYVETIITNVKSNYGIQGIEYLPSLNLFQINSHGAEFYRINTNFDNSSIVKYTAPFDLQGIAYLNSTTMLYNNRAGQKIEFVDINVGTGFKSISSEYTVAAWFNPSDTSSGRRQMLFETNPDWSISAELAATSNNLKYSIKTDGNYVIEETNVKPPEGVWSHVAITYVENQVSKIYYNGQELTDYEGSPTGTLYSIDHFNIGTYRDANDRWFEGKIDEVYVFNRALSADEISDLYNNYGYTTTNYPEKVLVRKYTEPEPTWSSFGAEQSQGWVNSPPSFSDEQPTNGSIGIPLQPTCHINVSDSDNDNMTIYWYENSTGTWVLRQTNSSVKNGTYYWHFTQASSGDTTYWWKVAVNDSIHNVSAVYHFTTAEINISISPTTLSISGNPATGTSVNTTANYFTVYNNGTANITVKIAINNSADWTYCNWSYYNSGYHLDYFTCNFTTDGTTWTNIEVKNASGEPQTVLFSNLQANTSATFGIKIWIPKYISTTAQQQFEVYLKAY